MPERVTAADRLSRILYLIPAAARDGGIRLADLARALEVDETTVLRDIEELTAREYYHTGASGGDVQVTIDGDRVRIWTKGELRRPVRLSPREALALGLGLRALAAEAEPARRGALLALATRLEQALTVPAVATQRSEPFADRMESRPEESAASDRGSRLPPHAAGFATVLADDDEDILSIVVDAVRRRRVCRIRYLKAGAAAPVDREIHPYRLVHAEGRWYLLAYAVDRAGVRIFRLDRILAAAPGAASFTVPDNFDPARYIAEGGRVFLAHDDVEVAVRYSPRIARWIAERVACEPDGAGGVVVRHRVADPRWVVRHVLQYGADAEVLEPAVLRAAVAAAARRVGGPGA